MQNINKSPLGFLQSVIKTKQNYCIYNALALKYYNLSCKLIHSNLSYLDETRAIVDETTAIDKSKDMKIISSICKSELSIVNKKGKLKKETQYIASTILCLEDIDFKILLYNALDMASTYITIRVIIVSFTNSSEESSIIEESRKFLEEGIEIEKKGRVILEKVNLFTFIKNLDTYLSMNITSNSSEGTVGSNNYFFEFIIPSPIFIFEGISWSNIKYLFNIHGKIINGGTISRRHKLSLCELKLSMFLIYSNLFLDKNFITSSYSESKFTNPLYDELYHIFVNSDLEDIVFEHTNPLVYQYYKSNLIIKGKLAIEKLLKFIQHFEIKISMENHRLTILDKEISSLDFQISKFYLGRNLEYAKQKHKSTLTNRFRLLKEERDNLVNEKSALLVEINKPNSNANNLEKLNFRLDRITNELAKLENLDEWSRENKVISIKNEPELKSIKKDFSIYRSKTEIAPSSVLVSSLNNKSYSTISNKRSYSTLPASTPFGVSTRERISKSESKSSDRRMVLNQKTYMIDSFIYKELIRLVIENPQNEETQLKIENLLLNQSKLILSSNINETKDLNYAKLSANSKFSELLVSKIPMIESLLNIERNKEVGKKTSSSLITDSSDKTKNISRKKQDYYKWKRLLKFCPNAFILDKLLGRMLRIISNNRILNKNTAYTENAIDIASDIINDYFYGLYKEKTSSEIMSLVSESMDSNTVNENNTSINVNLSSDMYSEDKTLKYTYSMWKLENKKLIDEYSDKILLFNIGNNIFKILIELELVDIIPVQTAYDKSTQMLILGHELKKINTNNYFSDLSFKVPMIVKPKEWSRYKSNGKFIENLGGFLNNDEKFIIPLIIENWELKEKSNILDNNLIFDIINNLQNVAFMINTEVLDFLISYGIEYDMLIDPDFIHPLESKKKLTMKQTKTLESFISKKKLEYNIIGLANIFKYVNEFYIPLRMDNRGRIYCNVDYLNYQGTELAKALLLFSKGNIIYKTDQKAINYLKIYGANCYGNKLDKESFEERINWVNKNEENIINLSLLKTAENKLLFLAFCFEYKKYYNSLSQSTKFFISHLPIQLDATCNGFQHLALLTGDEDLAKHLNLSVSSWKDKPDDFYSFLSLNLKDHFQDKLLVLQLIKQYLDNTKKTKKIKEKEGISLIDLETAEGVKSYNKLEESMLSIINNLVGDNSINSIEDLNHLIESYHRLSIMNIHRRIIKKPAMTKIYNVTHFSMSNYIKDEFEYIENEDYKDNWYVNKEDPNIKLKGKDINLLTKGIDYIIYSKFPKYDELNKYLKEIAKICVLLQIPILWLLPTGLEVMQSYVTKNEIKVKPFKYRSNTFIIKEPTNIFNKRKQVRALMPNLVHSLDAASLGLLTDIFFSPEDNQLQFKNFYAIHDCFATTANLVDLLSNKIKAVYFQLYSNETYLLKFDKKIRESILLQYGDKVFDSKNNLIIINGSKINFPNIHDIISQKDNNLFYENMLKSSYPIN